MLAGLTLSRLIAGVEDIPWYAMSKLVDPVRGRQHVRGRSDGEGCGGSVRGRCEGRYEGEEV